MQKESSYAVKLGNTADYVFDFDTLHYREIEESIKMLTGMPASYFKRKIVFHSLVQLMDMAHVDAIYDFIQIALDQFKKKKLGDDLTINIVYNMITPKGSRRILDQFKLQQSKGSSKIFSIGRFTDISHIEKSGLPQIFILEGNKLVFEKKADANKLLKEESLPLSETELKILKLSAKGFSPAEIADKMKLSVATIYSHRKNIKSKMKMEFASAMNILRKREII